MDDFISIKSSSPMGDLLAMLPSLRQLNLATGKKIMVYQALNVVGQGDIHVPQAFANEQGQSIMMGEQTFRNLVPLIKRQPYIEDMVEYRGEKVDYDMDEIRFKTFTNQAMGSLSRATFYAFPDMACDLSGKCLEVEPNFHYIKFFDRAIINFTSRFRNNWVNYYFLKEHQDKLLFAGLSKERDEFCNKWLLDIPLLEFEDFYELATMINSCKFFMSNQTGFWWIAENLKIPRLLETCPQLPHVIPMGANGYDFYHQQALELYFNKLIQ